MNCICFDNYSATTRAYKVATHLVSKNKSLMCVVCEKASDICVLHSVFYLKWK